MIRAALEQSIAQDLTPVIEEARRADGPMHGLPSRLVAGDREPLPPGAALRDAPPSSSWPL